MKKKVAKKSPSKQTKKVAKKSPSKQTKKVAKKSPSKQTERNVASAPSHKKNISKLRKVRVIIKKGPRRGKVMTVYRRREELDDRERYEKERKEQDVRDLLPIAKPVRKKDQTLPLSEYDLSSENSVVYPASLPPSLMSPFYMEVPFKDVDGKNKWKAYPNKIAYRKDFPEGPQEGHLLVNQNHPDHLNIKHNAVFAKVNGVKFNTLSDFLLRYSVPSPDKLKILFRNGERKGFRGKIYPDFRNEGWHSSQSKLNKNQRVWLGVEDSYREYRAIQKMRYDKEKFARSGVPWSKSDYNNRRDILDLSGDAGAKKLREKLFRQPKNNNPIANIALKERLESAGNIKKGTPIKFLMRGKVYVGKVVRAIAYGDKGVELKNKAATHFQVQYTKKGKLDIVELPKEQIERVQKAYKRKSKGEVALDAMKRRQASDEALLSSAKVRLGVKSDPEFQSKVLELMSGEHGLESSQNPINKFLERKIEKIVGAWGSQGSLQTMRGADGKLYVQDISHADLMHAARTGVYEAILEHDPKKGELTQFLSSDLGEHFIRKALNHALITERNMRWDTLDHEGRALISHLKWAKEAFRISNDGREPTTPELVETYKHQYPEEHANIARRKSYNLDRIIDHMKRSRVANVFASAQPGMEGGELDILDQQHSRFKTPEESFLEKEQMREMKLNLYRTLLSSFKKTGHAEPEKIAKQAAAALMLRHRVDESTTGAGVFGENSPHYQKNDAAHYEKKYHGKTNTGKIPYLRNLKVVGRTIGTTAKEADHLIDDASQRIRDAYTTGDAHATKLFNQFFRKSFEYNYTMLKSYCRRYTEAEKQSVLAWRRAHRMAGVIFLAA